MTFQILSHCALTHSTTVHCTALHCTADYVHCSVHCALGGYCAGEHCVNTPNWPPVCSNISHCSPWQYSLHHPLHTAHCTMCTVHCLVCTVHCPQCRTLADWPSVGCEQCNVHTGIELFTQPHCHTAIQSHSHTARIEMFSHS